VLALTLPKLKGKGVKKFTLEVLKDNEPAIKAYRKAGFRIARELDCYELEFDSAGARRTTDITIELQPIGKSDLTAFVGSLDWQPSWENSFAAIRRIPDDVLLLGARSEEKLVGLLAYYPTLNWIMSAVVIRAYRRRGIATALLRHLLDQIWGRVESVKLLNVNASDRGMGAFLEKNGFQRYVSQYEMECAI
jgi:ribosomal protein S18 acetylase RimI-like enzyme